MTRPLRATHHCRHYSYERTGNLEMSGPRCALGVKLETVLKCMPDPREGCELRQEYTDEERAAWDADVKEGQDRMIRAFVAIAENVGIIKPRQQGKTPCPNCGNDLHYSRGRNRVWIACKTPDCVQVEVEPDPKKPWPASAEKGKGDA